MTDSPAEIFNNKAYKFGTKGMDSITIDEIWSSTGKGIQLVHLDVEGHEYDCLKGAQMCIKNGQTVFVVEILHTNEHKEHIIDLFSKYGYQYFIIYENVGWWGDKGYNYVFYIPKKTT
jgi:hypothetical protein